jgi:hypothetical protein
VRSVPILSEILIKRGGEKYNDKFTKKINNSFSNRSSLS